MSQRLKKKDSPTSLAFDEDAIKYIKQLIEELDLQSLREDFLKVVVCSTNGKDQLNFLKQLTVKLKENVTKDIESVISLLCSMFIYCVSRHPMRRTLISVLQNMSSDEKYKALIIVLMSTKIKSTLLEKSTDMAFRENTDMITALMENFKLGEEIIQHNCDQVLLYLNMSLRKSIVLARNMNNPVQQTKIMQNILASLKTVIAVFQKCEHVIAGSIGQSEQSNKDAVLQYLTSYLDIACDIMLDDFFILDCRCAAAMLFPAQILILSDISIHSMLVFISSFILDSWQTSESNFDHDDHQLANIISNKVEYFFERSLNESSLLVFLSALLVKIPVSVLHAVKTTTTTTTTTLFEDVFVLKLIDISKVTTNKNTLVLAFKTINFWVTEALKKVLEDTPNDAYSILVNVVSIKVLSHLVTYIDHQIDTVRHHVNISIKNCFVVLSKTNNEELIRKIACEYFEGDMKSRGKISMLINLTQFIVVEDILGFRSSLPIDIINLLADVDLASHACDLYHTISIKHLSDLQSKSLDLTIWMQHWVEQIYEPLSIGSKEIKANIVNHVIPSLLKIHPSIIFKLLSTSTNGCELIQVRTVIVFLKSLRAMKNIPKGSEITFDTLHEGLQQKDGMWKNLINMEDLKKCLTHIDDQVRLDAISLICSSVKTTDPINIDDIVLIKYFLEYNMASENPSLRQQVITNLKKLIIRLFTHAFQLTKLEQSETESSIDVYVNFLSWLVKFSFEKLHSSAPYCQLSLSLELLLLIATLFGENSNSKLLNSIVFTTEEKYHFTKVLINCFDDTYDPNRLLVYCIFSMRPIFCSALSTSAATVIFKNILERLSSPQPDVSSVAAYYMNFLVLTVTPKDMSELSSIYESKVTDGKLLTSIGGYFISANNELNSIPVILDILMHTLKCQLSIMKKSLITASQNSPLYGVLYCIRMIFQLQNINYNHSIVKAFQQSFPLFLKDLVQLGIEIIELVAQYVSSDAPEGYLCDASLAEVFQQLNLEELNTSNIEFQAQVARMLLVCCWRSMKEVSLLLGVIVSNFSSTSQPEAILPKSLYLTMWNVFSDILLRSKHAGAYELASLGFIKLCSVLWSSDDVELQVIPANAVKLLIAELLSKDAFNNAQVTRRSAGLPFYLQALCTTEPPIKSKQSFKLLMISLTDLCKNNMKCAHDVNKLVIALNILRAFYKDAKLCEDVFPYISDGVIIAVHGFSSSNWAIRNSCTLLFSALMQRMFGVKKFRMTGREFFSRFPALYCFLMNQSKAMSAVTEVGTSNHLSLHPSIFPVLLLLSHLYPSTIEASDSLMKLSGFIPYIMSCGSSSVYKTRTMAAKALVPLTSSEQMYNILTQLLTKFQSLNGNRSSVNQNMVHGNFLQLKCLLERYIHQNSDNIGSLVERTNDTSWLLLCDQICHTTKAVYLDILIILYENKCTNPNTVAMKTSMSALLQSRKTYNPESVGYTIYLRSAINYVSAIFEKNHMSLVKVCKDMDSITDPVQLILALLHSNCKEVRLKTIISIIPGIGNISTFDEFIGEFWQMVSSYDVKSEDYAQIIETFSEVMQSNFSVETALKLWKQWLCCGVFSDISDELKVAVLKYLAVIIPQLCSLDPNINLLLSSEMWKFIEKCSRPEQCFEAREQVANILCFYSTTTNNLSEGIEFKYVKCCINLLKDADSDVRNQAAENLCHTFFPQVNEFFKPQPSVVIEALFTHLLNLKMKYSVHQCVRLLLSLVLQLDDLDQLETFLNEPTNRRCMYGDGEDQRNSEDILKKFVVFEEGKANPYFDEKEICELAYNVIEKHCEDITCILLSGDEWRLYKSLLTRLCGDDNVNIGVEYARKIIRLLLKMR